MSVNPESLKNLKTISPENRNKKGRPPSFTKHLRQLLTNEPEHVAKINAALLKQAKKGNLGHISMVYDRIDGPNKQKIDVSIYSDAFSKGKKEELEEIISKNL